MLKNLSIFGCGFTCAIYGSLWVETLFAHNPHTTPWPSRYYLISTIAWALIGMGIARERTVIPPDERC